MRPVARRDKALLLRIVGAVVLVGGIWVAFAIKGGSVDGCPAVDAGCPGGFDGSAVMVVVLTLVLAAAFFGLAFWLNIDDD